ncbi:MAG: aminotransferase class V-fold PLP-dependent enzyme [Vicinamibacteria bacterium]
MNVNGAAPGSPFAALWPLDSGVDYLNHGSFGACPRALLEHQWQLRLELEREPVDFLWRHWGPRLDAARAALAAFVCADADDLAFVTNATTGINVVARALELRPGDEILTTDHAYAASRKAFEFVSRGRGARVVAAAVPFPLESADQILAPLLASVSARTRLALLDHVTSPTGLVFPIERIVAELRERGVETLVDGAHAPGMLPLDLRRIGAAYYAGNAHKWLCAPKGAAFLHVRRDLQGPLHPLVISHGYEPGREGRRFRAEFDWTGTADPTAWLTIPECIRYLGGLLPGGWSELMARNRALALRARTLLCDALSVPAPCPESLLGSLASLPLPAPAPDAAAARLDHEGVMNWLRERGVEGWLFPWPGPAGKLVRASAQLYNHEEQYRRLGRLLREALGG